MKKRAIHLARRRPPGRRRWLAWFAIVGGLLILTVAVATRGAGLSAHRAPWPAEEWLARTSRAWLLPGAYRRLSNPVPKTPEALRAGMMHWADHCASCHDNDGRGRTPLGMDMFPSAPDMTGERTQRQTDGALFYAIEHGVPYTGMPGWSTGTTEGERASWELVLFVRHLPALTAAEVSEMEKLNPKSSAQLEQQRRMQEFLKGGAQ